MPMCFFQIVFIAQIQVAQQYSSLTTQNNSVAVTGKAFIFDNEIKTDAIHFQQTATDYLEVFGTL